MKFPITSGFKSTEKFRDSPHNGIDLAMEKGTEIYSINDGIVKVVDYGKENIGKGILVKWEDGKTAIYGHLSETKVYDGDIVKAGDLLGLSGNSGNVVGENGYHLHFGLKDTTGKFIDPTPYNAAIQKMGENISNQRLNISDMLNQAMDSFTELQLNTISQLPDVHTISQALHVIFLSIT